MDQLNQVIFLDYHEVYAGLCNQLYLITNHIYEAYQKKTKIYINKINIDIFKNERVPATDVFDFVKTNKNINKLIGMDLILYEKPLNFYTLILLSLKKYLLRQVILTGAQYIFRRCFELNNFVFLNKNKDILHIVLKLRTSS